MSGVSKSTFGLTEDHIAPLTQGEFTLSLHSDVIEPFTQLKNAASKHNIDMTIASSFRSFERQALIWNNKFLGNRPVYNRENKLVDMSQLSEWQKVQAILTFSALPGASRHHWGTDMDVFDANAMPKDYQLQLSPEEYSATGVFHKLSLWLQDNIKDFGFYQPYIKQDMGIAQEIWHLSYAPTASRFSEYFQNNSHLLLPLLADNNVLGHDSIKKHFDHILNTYVFCAALPPEPV